MQIIGLSSSWDVNEFQVNSSEINSDQVNSSEFELNQVKSSEFKWIQVNSSEFTGIKWIHWNQVNSLKSWEFTGVKWIHWNQMNPTTHEYFYYMGPKQEINPLQMAAAGLLGPNLVQLW